MRQISPSTTAFGLLTALTIAFATSGKRPVRSLSLRDTSLHSPPRTYATARKPSNFTSCAQSSPCGNVGVERRQHRLVRVLHELGAVVVVVVALDQQPVLLLAVHVRGHERPAPLQLLAVQVERQLPVRLLLEQVVGAVVEDLDRPAAVLALRDLAVERRVLERVVLDVHRERLRARLERHALRHGPGRERPASLQAEVVVQPAGVVALHDEDRLLAALVRAERLGRDLRIALLAVFAQRSPRKLYVKRCSCARGTSDPFHRHPAKRGLASISPGQRTPELLHLTGG